MNKNENVKKKNEKDMQRKWNESRKKKKNANSNRKNNLFKELTQTSKRSWKNLKMSRKMFKARHHCQ
jgi:hypothetical protein